MIRVAVASSDGQTINEHFGQASRFIIYEVEDDGSHRQVETRQVTPGCSAHAPGGAADQLGDVQAVFAAQVGPGSSAALQEKGIKAFNLNGSIAKALTAYGKRRKLFEAHIPGVSSCGPSGGCGPCGGANGRSCS
ncbi:NifB/NifX family molybdenum-iron cluster-binding protein [Geotalea sp. SG265]|uniref:NifB/NifX family molybdenum-iron cluster-binding protein n=1 Tax=Geotalea sp. SG265 TaxID=2922867 RepID=UPI001FAF964F|nr:NifB/NifX family molybdenum-iron cluster-binding protein [Geotalea sp. SG265]